MPLHNTFLKGSMCTFRERYVHIGSATDEGPTSGSSTRNRSGLPATSGKRQRIALQQVVQKLHAILLVMHILPLPKQRPPCRHVGNQLFSLLGAHTWMRDGRVDSMLKRGCTPGGAVWCMQTACIGKQLHHGVKVAMVSRIVQNNGSKGVWHGRYI